MSKQANNPAKMHTTTKSTSLMEFLPPHIRNEMQSKNMHMISDANMMDPRTANEESKITTTSNIAASVAVPLVVLKGAFTESDAVAVFCYTMGDIFRDVPISDNDALRLFLQAMVIVYGGQIADNQILESFLRGYGIVLAVQTVDVAIPEEMTDIKHDQEAQDVKNLLGLANIGNPYIACLAYCGAVMLLAGKQLSDVSAQKWTERRVIGLAASMGITVSPASILRFDVKNALKVYQKVSALYMVRSTLVRIILGTVGQNNLAGNLSSAMHNLLAWAEMNHIRLVHEFLFGRYPELLTMRQLQGSTLGVLSDAWQYLGTLEKAERPFAKLLYSPNQTKALQRDRFVLLTDAAHAVGNHIYSSFTNYQGDTAGSLGRSIKMAVSEYLTSLDAIGATTVKAAHIAVTNTKLLDSLKRVDEIFSSHVDRVEEDIDEMVRT